MNRNKLLGIKWQLYLLVVLLTALAAWRIYLKVHYLGFSFTPKAKTTVWMIEAKVNFTAGGKPVKVSLTLPAEMPGYKILDEEIASPGYGVSIANGAGGKQAVWTRREASGKQTLYYRIKIYDLQETAGVLKTIAVPPKPTPPPWDDPQRSAANQIIAQAREKSIDPLNFTTRLLQLLIGPNPEQEVKFLLSGHQSYHNKVIVAQKLLQTAGLPCRIAQGILLKEGRHWQPASSMLEVYSAGGWHIFDPHTGREGIPANFVMLRRGGDSLLDVEGGTQSSVHFSVLKAVRDSYSMVGRRAMVTGKESFFNFSVYSLPLESQSAFKLLALIPLGILVIVFLRNVVGVQTMGTFMPTLIALSFLDTNLLPGIVFFTIIISIGLLIRTYLSRLNLLLVPRISAVVIVVILIMEVVSIVSYRLGFQAGLTVTFFPLIILAWTIERASILWEEDGPVNAFKQIAASLLAGILTYFLLSGERVQHIMYAFSEINLVILGLTMLLGTYTGYRLTELRRFKPLTEPPSC